MFRWVNINQSLRTEKAGMMAANLADILPEEMVRLSQLLVRHKSFVCDGRTCGIEMFRDADYKFHITADIKERMRRRVNTIKDEEIFLERDSIDQKRIPTTTSCVIIQTTGKTKEYVLEEILTYVN